MPIVAMEQPDDRKLLGWIPRSNDAVNDYGSLVGLAGPSLISRSDAPRLVQERTLRPSSLRGVKCKLRITNKRGRAARN